MKVSDQLHTQAAYRRLCGPQGLSGRYEVEKNRAPAEN
jgi:hypothetical protein